MGVTLPEVVLGGSRFYIVSWFSNTICVNVQKLLFRSISIDLSYIYHYYHGLLNQKKKSKVIKIVKKKNKNKEEVRSKKEDGGGGGDASKKKEGQIGVWRQWSNHNNRVYIHSFYIFFLKVTIFCFNNRANIFSLFFFFYWQC